MKVLIGTTNPAKAQWLANLLDDDAFEILTLKDFPDCGEPSETGDSPEENARLKAAYYAHLCECVICNDSGLYIEELPMNDPRQPGLHVRTPDSFRMNDEQMIDYYAKLIETLGGRVTCFYLNGFAVCRGGAVQGMTESVEYARMRAFDMVSTPNPMRLEGWPLDSLSIDRKSGLYFVERSAADEKVQQTNQALQAFLMKCLKGCEA